MKCLWKIVKTIPNWAGDLDYDTILLEVHNFFKVKISILPNELIVYIEKKIILYFHDTL